MYTLSTSQFITLSIYDILGREVQTLVSSMQEPGSYSITFRANELASGLYIYTLTSESGIQLSKKMLVLN